MIDLPIYTLGEPLPTPRRIGDMALRQVGPPSWTSPGWTVHESMTHEYDGKASLVWCVIGIGCTQHEALVAAGLEPTVRKRRASAENDSVPPEAA